jgi:hypothetical protein
MLRRFLKNTKCAANIAPDTCTVQARSGLEIRGVVFEYPELLLLRPISQMAQTGSCQKGGADLTRCCRSPKATSTSPSEESPIPT